MMRAAEGYDSVKGTGGDDRDMRNNSTISFRYFSRIEQLPPCGGFLDAVACCFNSRCQKRFSSLPA
jgi:hypothetical protein